MKKLKDFDDKEVIIKNVKVNGSIDPIKAVSALKSKGVEYPLLAINGGSGGGPNSLIVGKFEYTGEYNGENTDWIFTNKVNASKTGNAIVASIEATREDGLFTGRDITIIKLGGNSKNVSISTGSDYDGTGYKTWTVPTPTIDSQLTPKSYVDYKCGSNLTKIKEVVGSEVWGPTVWDFDIEKLRKVRIITVTNKSNVTGSDIVATFVFANNDIDAQIEAGAIITAYANINFTVDGGYPRIATYTINFDLSVGYASFGYHEAEGDMWFFKSDNKDVITFWG